MNIAIFTNFNEFNPGYSLTGIVIDQAEMLAKYGHNVVIVVNEQFNSKFNVDVGLTNLILKYGEKVKLIREMPFLHLIDYETKTNLTEEHKQGVEVISEKIKDLIDRYELNAIFTHDFIFTGWNLPYSLGMKKIQKEMKSCVIRWLHWIHSIPSGHRDWWNLEEYPGYNYIVFPTRTEVNRVAESFLTSQSKVLLIPHIKDIRNWYDFSEETRSFIDSYPNIMQAGIIQVYPCSSDRLFAKQLHLLIRIFGFMKQARCNVFLLAANQWATGKQRKEDISKYLELAKVSGLEYGKEFVFTSEHSTKYEAGISKRMLRELQLIGNLFVFPTLEESFGLVGPESAFSGSLTVINKSLPMLTEVMGFNTPHYDFGSFLHNVVEVDNDQYLKNVAFSILNRIYTSDSVMTKTYCRIRYNMDNIYNRYYLPYLH